MVPEPLINQLKSPGRMFIPVGTGMQQVIQVSGVQYYKFGLPCQLVATPNISWAAPEAEA